MKVGFSMYSFNRLIKAGQSDRTTAVTQAASLGADCIEMLDVYWTGGHQVVPEKAEVAAFRKHVDGSGIELSCYTLHNNFGAEDPKVLQAEVDRVKRQIDVGVALGVKVMRIESCYGPPMTPGVKIDPAPYEARVVQATREAAAHAAKAGIRLGMENHGRLIATSRQMVSVIKRVNSPFYGATIDVGNFAVVDEPSIDATRALAPYAVHVHAKDFHLLDPDQNPGEGWGRCNSGRWYQGCAIGEGDIPVKECLKILVKSGYKGALSVEYEGKDVDVLDGIRRGLVNLKKIVSQLKA